jgi:hypothetical protein
MDLNPTHILSTLAALRPLFHSEADLQHALAWEFHHRWPDADVCLESPRDREGDQNPTLTTDEPLVCDAIRREGRLPEGTVRLADGSVSGPS